jgi:hypothetical protein
MSKKIVAKSQNHKVTKSQSRKYKKSSFKNIKGGASPPIFTPTRDFILRVGNMLALRIYAKESDSEEDGPKKTHDLYQSPWGYLTDHTDNKDNKHLIGYLNVNEEKIVITESPNSRSDNNEHIEKNELAQGTYNITKVYLNNAADEITIEKELYSPNCHLDEYSGLILIDSNGNKSYTDIYVKLPDPTEKKYDLYQRLPNHHNRKIGYLNVNEEKIVITESAYIFGYVYYIALALGTYNIKYVLQKNTVDEITIDFISPNLYLCRHGTNSTNSADNEVIFTNGNYVEITINTMQPSEESGIGKLFSLGFHNCYKTKEKIKDFAKGGGTPPNNLINKNDCKQTRDRIAEWFKKGIATKAEAEYGFFRNCVIDSEGNLKANKVDGLILGIKANGETTKFAGVNGVNGAKGGSRKLKRNKLKSKKRKSRNRKNRTQKRNKNKSSKRNIPKINIKRNIKRNIPKRKKNSKNLRRRRVNGKKTQRRK